MTRIERIKADLSKTVPFRKKLPFVPEVVYFIRVRFRFEALKIGSRPIAYMWAEQLLNRRNPA